QARDVPGFARELVGEVGGVLLGDAVEGRADALGAQVPTRSVAPRSRSRAMVERYDSRPVRGFSDGTLRISIDSDPNSPSTWMRWVLRVSPGTAKIRVVVRSGPTPASDRAASTLTLAGNAGQASVAGPSKISVSSRMASRSIFCCTTHGAPAHPARALR